MKQLGYQIMIITIALVIALVVVSGLIIGGLFLLLQSVMLFLTPILGEAAAYGIAGLTCILSVIIFVFLVVRQAKKVREQPSIQEPKMHVAQAMRRTVEDYPIESALVAAALGFSFNDKEELKSVLFYAMSNTDI